MFLRIYNNHEIIFGGAPVSTEIDIIVIACRDGTQLLIRYKPLTANNIRSFRSSGATRTAELALAA